MTRRGAPKSHFTELALRAAPRRLSSERPSTRRDAWRWPLALRDSGARTVPQAPTIGRGGARQRQAGHPGAVHSKDQATSRSHQGARSRAGALHSNHESELRARKALVRQGSACRLRSTVHPSPCASSGSRSNGCQTAPCPPGRKPRGRLPTAASRRIGPPRFGASSCSAASTWPPNLTAQAHPTQPTSPREAGALLLAEPSRGDETFCRAVLHVAADDLDPENEARSRNRDVLVHEVPKPGSGPCSGA